MEASIFPRCQNFNRAACFELSSLFGTRVRGLLGVFWATNNVERLPTCGTFRALFVEEATHGDVWRRLVVHGSPVRTGPGDELDPLKKSNVNELS